MKRWMIGALAGACIGVGVYLALTKKGEPASAPPEPPAVGVAPATPLPPVVLARVVEVADLDPLLDPPEKPVAGEPFDADPRTFPVSAPAAPRPIPPAADPPAVEVAPMPRGAVIVPVFGPGGQLLGLRYQF